MLGSYVLETQLTNFQPTPNNECRASFLEIHILQNGVFFVWRVQVWKQDRIIEGFVFETKDEAEDKRDELSRVYNDYSHRIILEDIDKDVPKKEMDKMTLQIIFDILNPFNWFR